MTTSRAELRARGMSRREITLAVEEGTLVRARRDHYLPDDTPHPIVCAVRVGGRLTCLSLLELHGVYVLTNRQLHVHMKRTDGRMRSPHDRRRRLTPGSGDHTRLHWLPLFEPVGDSACVGIVDALAHSILCQKPRAAIATLDSALHRGLATPEQLPDVFGILPAKYRVLVPMIDGRAESGPETLMRLMLRALGCQVELQVRIDGVGRVDLLVDGWLVIECDSRAHHSGWAANREDRRRDLALAALGYASLRPTAEMITDHPEFVLAAVRAMLRTHATH